VSMTSRSISCLCTSGRGEFVGQGALRIYQARQRCGHDVLAGGKYSAQVGDGFLHAVWCRCGVHHAISLPAEDLSFIAGGTHAQRVEAGEFAASLPFLSSECTHTRLVPGWIGR
jgi:hypothetical protein